MSSDVELLDGAIPLVRNDQPWEWFVNFAESDGTPTDLTGKTVAAEIRWRSGSRTVVAAVAGEPANGQVRLSLDAADTAAMPLGRLSKLFVAINTDTEAIVPVDVMEGLFGVSEPQPTPAAPVNVLVPASGAIIVLTDFRPVYIKNPAVLASLFIRMPPGAPDDTAIEVSFLSPVTALQIQDPGGAVIAGAPHNAYGPGSGLLMRYVDAIIGWVYWT